ncbi:MULTISPECIES: hypothetical protein [unclassified Streptomyces]|uniref:hypothetical protein n=1 Tax=unclassified Streptomyces TaxID=2593676 RepID=UPI0036EE8195
MRVSLSTDGSREDVQPLAGLAVPTCAPGVRDVAAVHRWPTAVRCRSGRPSADLRVLPAVLAPETRARARDLADTVRTDGVTRGAGLLLDIIDPDGPPVSV